MLTAVVIVAHILGFVSSIDAVWNTRTSQGAIAWAVVLNTFPYVAVPAYWVLGRSRFEGYVMARQGEDSEIRHIALDAKELVEPYVSSEAEARYVEATRAAVQLAKIPVPTRERGRAPDRRRGDLRQYPRGHRPRPRTTSCSSSSS